MAKFVGTYVLESSTNFEDFMKALGVGMVMRKMANATTPTVTISEKEGTYVLKTASTMKTFEISFKLGQEFDEATSDGRQCKTTITKEGENKLVQVQKTLKGGKNVKFTREFTATHMLMECECEGVTCKRNYKRQ